MSVFKVKLNTPNQGVMDINPLTGVQNAISIQRTVSIMGPNRSLRFLKDGDTFTDSNYYKRFCYPAVSLADSILEVVTDDGTDYSDIQSENVFPLVWNPGLNDDGVIQPNTTYTDDGNYLDLVSTYGGPATFIQMTNGDSLNDVKVRLNGLTTAVLTLQDGDTQIFNDGDLPITKVEFDNSSSGGGSSPVGTITVIFGIKSKSNS